MLGVVAQVPGHVAALPDDAEPLGAGVDEATLHQLGSEPAPLQLGVHAGVGEGAHAVSVAMVELAGRPTVHQQLVAASTVVVVVGDLDVHAPSMPGSHVAATRRCRPYDAVMARTPLRPALAASVLILAALLVGCGASSGEDAGGDEATTTTEAEAATTEDDGGETTETTEAEEEATTTAASGGSDDEAVCAALQDLADSDAEANQLVAGGDWAKIQAFYVDNTDDIVAIYDELIAAETEVTAEFETLRAVTVSAGDLAAESTSLMDYSSKLTAQPGLAESGQAALDANDFAEQTCGFSLAGF